MRKRATTSARCISDIFSSFILCYPFLLSNSFK
nr:MAG TPA: hypothetical protein [Caudoviricetes sp.]DAY08797.1 MAG TPA: hypothetical protein [Caudoviricetes sp.]